MTDSKAREQAQRFWDSLSNAQRWDIGDDLVLGCFNAEDWFDEPLLSGTTEEMDKLRILWEQTLEAWQ